MPISKCLLAGALAFFALPACADISSLRTLVFEHATIAASGATLDSALQISVTADRQDATYAIGEAVHLSISANADVYVTVLAIGPNGKSAQLFPNARQTDNHLVANHPVEIGGGGRLIAQGPVGEEVIRIIASTTPVPGLSDAQLNQNHVVIFNPAGSTALVEQQLAALAQDAIPAPAAPVLTNFVLRTVGSRLPAHAPKG